LKKIKTYYWYLYEYLKNGDLLSVFASVNFLLFKKSHSKDRIIQTSTGKFFCRRNTNDFQFANYRYEWGVKKYILDHRKEYDVFVDGGACVGEYCVWLSQNGMRCFAFEPVMSNFEVIQKNLEINQLSDQVGAFSFGLGKQSSVVNFECNPVNTGASHISDQADSGDLTSEIRRFDDILPELKLNPEDRILFKLDVERMESDAIQGAAGFIQTYSNLTFILEDKHSGKESIVDALKELAVFEFGIVDEFNMYAKKTGNKPFN